MKFKKFIVMCSLIILEMLMVLGPLSLVRAEPPSADSSKAKEKTKAAVVFSDKKLFYVQERVLSFSPEDRARIISDRIKKLSKDPLFKAASIATVDAENSTDIVAGDLVVMTVTDKDAKVEGRVRKELAGQYAAQIRDTIEKYHKTYNLRSILLGILFTVIATAVLVVLLVTLNRVYPVIFAKLDSWRGTRIRSLKLQSLEILPAERITGILIGLAKGIRILVVAVIFYFYVPLVLSFFPWTRGFSATILDYILTPVNAVLLGFVSYLPNVFFIAVIVVVSRYVIKLVNLVFKEVQRNAIALPGFYPEWAEPTYKIVRFLIIAFTAIVIFPYLPGSQSPAFQGISIFLGVLFSLGSTSSVANVVAGVILTYMRGFKIGDRVKISDTIGDVIEKTLLITRVRTIKNVDITIPNAMVLGSHIINYSSSAKKSGLILHTTVTIGYDVPWRKVHELLTAAALSAESILENPAPFVLQTGLDDFFVRYELNAYTDQPGLMAKIYSDLHQNIQDKFNEAGIEIMSPHYSSLRDGNPISIPEDYLPKNYRSRGFRIFRTADADQKTDEKNG